MRIYCSLAFWFHTSLHCAACMDPSHKAEKLQGYFPEGCVWVKSITLLQTHLWNQQCLPIFSPEANYGLSTIPLSNLGHCQGYLQPKEGNAVSYHKKQSCQCRCLMCTLLSRSVLNREALPSSHGRTDVSLHPQVKLQLIWKAGGNVGQGQILWHWTQLCVPPLLTLLTTDTILHNPLQGVP